MNASAEAITSEAVERAYAGASDEWQDQAAAIIEKVALRMPEFTAEDVWDAGLERPDEPRAMGGVMRRAANAGLIEQTDRTRKANDPVCHKRPMAVWKSLVVTV